MKNTFKDYRLKIDADIFEAFPDYVACVVYAENLTNAPSDEHSVNFLRKAERNACARYAHTDLTNDAHVSAWREAFRRFGAKPKKHLCAAEALLSRVVSGEGIPAINRVVDIYNAVSIKHAIPIGGEDWSRITGDLRLTRAKGNEPFATMTSNGEQIDYPSVNEIIWADDSGATVRRWNWRQCFRTRITTDTRDAYFVLDRLSPLDVAVLKQVEQELVEQLKRLSPAVVITTEILTGGN